MGGDARSRDRPGPVAALEEVVDVDRKVSPMECADAEVHDAAGERLPVVTRRRCHARECAEYGGGQRPGSRSDSESVGGHTHTFSHEPHMIPLILKGIELDG